MVLGAHLCPVLTYDHCLGRCEGRRRGEEQTGERRQGEHVEYGVASWVLRSSESEETCVERQVRVVRAVEVVMR
jgi:hypothetical protein